MSGGIWPGLGIVTQSPVLLLFDIRERQLSGVFDIRERQLSGVFDIRGY